MAVSSATPTPALYVTAFHCSKQVYPLILRLCRVFRPRLWLSSLSASMAALTTTMVGGTFCLGLFPIFDTKSSQSPWSMATTCP